MTKFVKGKPGYYYKIYSNGKKVRVSKDDYIKSTYKSSAGNNKETPTFYIHPSNNPYFPNNCRKDCKNSNIQEQRTCLQQCWEIHKKRVKQMN